MSKPRKRANGEGTIYFDKTRDRWMAVLFIGERRKARRFLTLEDAEVGLRLMIEETKGLRYSFAVSDEQYERLITAIEEAGEESQGWVYALLAREVERIKIGYTTDIEGRLRVIQSLSPVDIKLLGVIRGTPQLEGLIQAAFDPIRHHGEWFIDAVALHSFIQAEFTSMPRWRLRRASIARAEELVAR